ncbi:MAG: hypothetical protein E2P00_08565 [Acidobacteria bacterium]|nr:MAG: hypothetical protein E2P00_08565 [Acidobacteriota bacterium]
MRNKALSGVFAVSAVVWAGGVLAAGSGCGTVDLLRALRAGGGEGVPGETLRAGGFDREELSSGGRFRLHNATVRGSMEPPAQVTEVARTLEAAWRVLVARGGWPDPARSRPVDVVLLDGLEQGPSRIVLLEDPGARPEDGVAASMVVTGSPRDWPLAALHQFLHILQVSQSADEGLWAYESSALALEDRLLGGGLLPPALLERRQDRPELSLTSDREELSGGAAPFLVWLAATRGDDLFTLWWQRAATEWGDNSLSALDTALRLGDQISLAESWRAYTVWSSYPGMSRRPGAGVPGLSATLPVTRSARTVSELPSSGAGPDALLIEPMGYAVIRLRDLGDVGAVTVLLEAETGALPEADLLITWPHVEAGWLSTPFVFMDGRAELNVPLAAGSEAVLIIRDRRWRGEALAVSWQIDADPGYPFELSFLAADSSPGRIELTWGSQSERGLFGWLVYRATDARGPFRSLGSIPFPALGEVTGPLEYHYSDTDVEEGDLYYYLVEGITMDGLARRSLIVARQAVGEGSGAAVPSGKRD